MSSDYDDIGWRARIDSSLSLLDQRTSVLDQRSHASEAHFKDLNLKLEGLQKSLEQLISGLAPLSSPWNNFDTANTAIAMQPSLNQGPGLMVEQPLNIVGKEQSAPQDMHVTSGVTDTSSYNPPISTVSLPPLSRRSTEASLDRRSEGAKKAFSFDDVVRIARDKVHNKAIKIQASLESLPEGRPLASTLASQGLNRSSAQPLTTTSASPGSKLSSAQVFRRSSPASSVTTVFEAIQEPFSYAKSPKLAQENIFQEVIAHEKTAQSSVSFAPALNPKLKGLEAGPAKTDRAADAKIDNALKSAPSMLIQRPSFRRGRTKLNLADEDIDIGVILKQAAEEDREEELPSLHDSFSRAWKDTETEARHHTALTHYWTVSKRTFKVIFWDVMGHDNLPMMVWDMIMLIAFLYIVIVTPYLIAFSIYAVNNVQTSIGAVDMTINAILMFDILLSFRLSYLDGNGKVVTDHLQIALNYITGWLALDLVSSLPWDNMTGDRKLAALKALRLLRTFKFLKVFQNLKVKGGPYSNRRNSRSIVQVLEEASGRSTFRLIRLILFEIAVLHWAACLFYYVASWQNFGPNTWVYKQNLVPTAEYPDQTSTAFKRYIYSLYWAVVTMMTIGYGDIVPISLEEKIATVVVILIGASMFAYFLGSMSSLIASKDSRQANISKKLAGVDEFISQRHFPRNLSESIRNFYYHCLPYEMHDMESDIISGLPKSMRTQVVLHLYKEAVDKIPMFKGKNPAFITSLVTHLKLEYYSPGDIVVQQGDVGHEMYFVVEGRLQVRVYYQDPSLSRGGSLAKLGSNSEAVEQTSLWQRLADAWSAVRPFKSQRAERSFLSFRSSSMAGGYIEAGVLEDGQVFGTYTCLVGERRPATVVAQRYCECYSLTRHDLEAVVAHWPELESEFTMLVTENDDMDDRAWEIRQEMGLPGRKASETMFGGDEAGAFGDEADMNDGAQGDEVKGIAAASAGDVKIMVGSPGQQGASGASLEVPE